MNHKNPTIPTVFLIINFVLLWVIFLLNFTPFLGMSNSLNAIITVLLSFLFFLIHGSMAWGVRNLVLFLLVTWTLSFTSEAVGVATGLIFGQYHYTDKLGPKILGVPLLIQVTYAAMGYASLMMARFILGLTASPNKCSILLTTTLGAFLMVGWDVCLDPFMSTVTGDWIWETGGVYFGIGIHNFVGWFVTVFVFMLVYQLIACYYPEKSPPQPSWGLWSQPVFYYAIMGISIILTPLVGGVPTPFASPANYTGSLESLIYSLCLITFFIMGTPSWIAIALLLIDKNCRRLFPGAKR